MFASMLAMNKRIYDKGVSNKIYNVMNNMKYSKYILDFDEKFYSNKFNLKMENKIFSDGAYVFLENNEIVSIYDYVNQTLHSNSTEFLEF